VFDDDFIDSYIELKMTEVERFEMTPHPVEFDMYYSPISVMAGVAANISGNAPATSATARRFRSPTICVANDFRCDRRFRSHRPPASSSSAIQSHVAMIAQIMPAGRHRINMLRPRSGNAISA
jgi:hypothetical protein